MLWQQQKLVTVYNPYFETGIPGISNVFADVAVLIAQHFDEVWSPEACNKMCDNCCKEISELSF